MNNLILQLELLEEIKELNKTLTPEEIIGWLEFFCSNNGWQFNLYGRRERN